MAPSPMMYQPNPNVAPLNGAQFIPGNIHSRSLPFLPTLRVNSFELVRSYEQP